MMNHSEDLKKKPQESARQESIEEGEITASVCQDPINLQPDKPQ